MVLISKFAYYKNKETKIKLHTPLPADSMVRLRKINGFDYAEIHQCWYILYLVKHAGKKTTGRYTHVANTTTAKIVSPLDRLKLNNDEKETEKPP